MWSNWSNHKLWHIFYKKNKRQEEEADTKLRNCWWNILSSLKTLCNFQSCDKIQCNFKPMPTKKKNSWVASDCFINFQFSTIFNSISVINRKRIKIILIKQFSLFWIWVIDKIMRSFCLFSSKRDPSHCRVLL